MLQKHILATLSPLWQMTSSGIGDVRQCELNFRQIKKRSIHTHINAQKGTLAHTAHKQNDIGTVKSQLHCSYGVLNLHKTLIYASACISSILSITHHHTWYMYVYIIVCACASICVYPKGGPCVKYSRKAMFGTNKLLFARKHLALAVKIPVWETTVLKLIQLETDFKIFRGSTDSTCDSG